MYLKSENGAENVSFVVLEANHNGDNTLVAFYVCKVQFLGCFEINGIIFIVSLSNILLLKEVRSVEMEGAREKVVCGCEKLGNEWSLVWFGVVLWVVGGNMLWVAGENVLWWCGLWGWKACGGAAEVASVCVGVGSGGWEKVKWKAWMVWVKHVYTVYCKWRGVHKKFN